MVDSLTTRAEADTALMPPAAAAAMLGVQPATLEVWRCTRRYCLPFVKVGRLVRYRRSDLLAFIEARTVGGTPAAEG